jgi:HAMP domain-containing protein
MKSDYKANDLLKKLKYMVERLKQPATIWKLVLFVFWLWVTWSSLNYRIQRLEEFKSTVDIMEIQTTLKEISVDLNRIKSEISKLNNLASK